MKKILGKEYGGSFGLGRKSLGTDTETWSQFRLPIPKPGFGRTLLLIIEKGSVRMKESNDNA